MTTAVQDQITDLAKRITAEGFRVFIAKRGTYGFYMDKDGAHVVTFAHDLGSLKFAGTYVSDNPQRTGTGWGLDTDTFAKMLQAPAPSWAHQGAKWRPQTLKEYLAVYGSSSQYVEVNAFTLARGDA